MRHRTIKLKNRKKIAASGKGYCDICHQQHFLTEHHIRGRKIPRYYHESNLAHICENCHREVHEGVIVIEGWFKTTDGPELIYHKTDQEALTDQEATPYLIERK